MESLPSELLLQVFSYLPFIYKYPLPFVSHRWFEHLKAGIWKEVYDHRLLNVGPDRRQMYASAIEALTLTSHKPCTHEELQGLEFTRLNTLVCQISLDRFETSFNTSYLMKYLVRTLRSVTLDLVADADLLDHLASSCNLRHIAFDLRTKRLSEDSVLEFLERCPGLEHVGFYNGHHSYTSDSLYDENFSPRILRQLAMQPSLRQIDSHHAIHGTTIDIADVSCISQTFASIERIETRESSVPRFSMLVAECRLIDELYVQIDPKARLEASRGRGSAIPVSTEPRHLSIRRQGLPFVYPCYITAFGGLMDLKSLYIDGRDITFKGRPFNSHDFGVLASRLTNLRRLILDCPQGRLTAGCLETLAENCPYIETVAIPWLQVDISYFVLSPEDQDLKPRHREGPQPLLPSLKEMNVKDITHPKIPKCDECASILGVLFPEVIRVGTNKFLGGPMGESSRLIEEAWKEMRAKEERPLELGWKPDLW
ncbi:hypothetical protein BDW69DRAFT_186734 [Aspergillus filifer]